MSRPMTSRQAHRAYLDKTRRPQVSRAEERRAEREEQERIREEQAHENALARARVARERKRAREEEGRRERRRRGEPVVDVSASQGVISGFLRRGGGVKGGRAGENARNGGGGVSKGGAGLGDENVRNAGAASEGVSGRVGDENKENAGGVSEQPGGRVGGGNTNAKGPVSKAPGGKTASEKERHQDSPATDTAMNISTDHIGNGHRSEPPRVGGAVQDDATELDDLFLSASQLAREVESMPPPPRKRSRDEAFPPEPPKSPPPAPADPDLEAYDLGISSQELGQLEVEVPALHSNGKSPPPKVPVELPDPEPPEPPGIGFSQQSFELCSQELREIDALVADLPTKHPTTNTNTNTNTNTRQSEQPASPNSKGDALEEPRPATSADTANAAKQSTAEAEEDEPKRFFTSCSQELLSLAEKRSRETAAAEARRRKREAPVDARDPCGAGGCKVGGPASGEDGVARPRAERGPEAREQSRGHFDLDDDAWWADLDDTDLEALLA